MINPRAINCLSERGFFEANILRYDVCDFFSKHLAMDSVWKAEETGELGIPRPIRNETDHHCVEGVMAVILAIFVFCVLFRLCVRIEQTIEFVFTADAARQSSGNNDNFP